MYMYEHTYVYVHAYIYSSYDETIQRKQSAIYRTRRAMTVTVTLTSAEVSAYDQVVRPHRSHRPSGGLPRGKPWTRHMWICLQLSGARGVNNGGVKGIYVCLM